LCFVPERVFEPGFLDCSYGFRPGRSTHDALMGLHNPTLNTLLVKQTKGSRKEEITQEA
jgi:hypothetical protein